MEVNVCETSCIRLSILTPLTSLLSFLVAMSYIFFHDSSIAARTFLAVLLGLLVVVVTLVMMVECAANSAKDTMRQKLSSFVVSRLL